MTAACCCGVIVDGGASGVIAKTEAEIPARLWADYALLSNAMVTHMTEAHANTVPVEQIMVWALGVECARFFTSSDPNFEHMRTANREGFVKRIHMEPMSVYVGNGAGG